MNYKRYSYIALLSILLSLLFIIGFVIIVDPYQQYKKNDKYVYNTRLESPGIAKHHDYDAVIMGSSMAMNHYPSQVDSLFGWNTINLTITGALDYDYSVLMPFVTQIGKMKHLIMSIDHFSFIRPIVPLDLYLYDNSVWNDYEYWLNYTSVKNAINIIKNEPLISRDELFHFNQPVGREYVLKSFQKDNHFSYFTNYDFNHIEQRLDEMLLKIMPDLSDVDIFVYFPPYSILKFKLYEQHGFWNRITDFKQYAIEKMLKYPNVKLYDFQKEEFICNLDEYMDIFHHSHDYNKRIIECMYKDSCRVNKDNYKRDLAVLDSLVRHYRLND